jgi:membrane-associated phospholipid phosphatase
VAQARSKWLRRAISGQDPSIFQDFHDGSAVLGRNSLGSCVTFPSFYTIMGLIVAAMWRKTYSGLCPGLVWLALMLFSTLPFGGHYVVDLIGGSVVWGPWFALSWRIERYGWAPLAALGRFWLAASEA